jgi:hypothetical protein
MPDPRYDPAVFVSKAKEAREVADSARAALRDDIVERGARLGIARDELAADIHANKELKEAAERQVQRELAEAQKQERVAERIERELAKDSYRDPNEVERVTEARALAEVARQRATAADERADRLDLENARMRDNLFGIERQLAAEPERRKQLEEAVDRLEETAFHFDDLSRNATRIAEQERIAAEAELRGDTKLVERANQLADTSRQAIDFGVQRQFTEADSSLLNEIGVVVPNGFYDPPSSSPATSSVLDDAAATSLAFGDRSFEDDGTELLDLQPNDIVADAGGVDADEIEMEPMVLTAQAESSDDAFGFDEQLPSEAFAFESPSFETDAFADLAADQGGSFDSALDAPAPDDSFDQSDLTFEG